MRRLYFTFSLKSKIAVLLILLFFTSCRTKEVIKTEYVRDSVEVAKLTAKLSEREQTILSLESKIKESTEQFRDAVNRLEVSENEKQFLKESFETTIKEYDDHGRLVKETYSRRVTDFVKELNSYKAENSELKESLFNEKEMNIVLQKENNRLTDALIESNKKVEFLESVKTKTKTTQKPAWWLWISILLNVVLIVYVFRKYLPLPFKLK